MEKGSKTVLVTGGSQGIGAVIATTFAAAGYNVAINCYNAQTQENGGNQTADACRAHGAGAECFIADVSDFAACEELVKSIDAGSADAQRIDLMMDRACYADMEQYALKSKDKTVQECIKAMADLLNLRTFLRIRKSGGKADAVQAAMVPGGHIDEKTFVDSISAANEGLYKQLRLDRYADVVSAGLEEYIHSGSLSTLERASDDYITGLFRERRYDIFSVLPLIGYLIAKERETQAVRLMMVSKLNDVPSKLVMERLRGLYE